MTQRRGIMMLAGDPSGDALAAELVGAIQAEVRYRAWGHPLKFIGAGGPKMAAAGVELVEDLTQHSIIGLWEAVKKYWHFRGIFNRLLRLAMERQPALIVLVDFSGFNRRFAAALRRRSEHGPGSSQLERVKLAYFISPQVWATRPGRARTLERDLDLLISIFPFERAWYAEHAPGLKVEYVGHPIVDRFADTPITRRTLRFPLENPLIVLLPGSRASEIQRHWPVMLEAVEQLQAQWPARYQLLMANETLVRQVREYPRPIPANVQVKIGGLPQALAQADLAIASTGTVTMECAYFGVPTIALYKTSWSTFQIGRRIIRVPYLAMPNLWVNREVFPEFIQGEARGDTLCGAALELLRHESRYRAVQNQLEQLRLSLGARGVQQRAARALLNLVEPY